MSEPSLTLVCFAVKEEARYFRQVTASHLEVEVLLTGIGRRNAEQAIRSRFGLKPPDLVISSGFAGGLRPELATGTVLFAAERDRELAERLRAAGASPGRFTCVDRVATTVEQKRELWQVTGADAVEMESEIVCAVCREQAVPSAIIRVILDTAGEDLPLDFNQFMGPDAKLHTGKLALRLAKSPSLIPALLRLNRQSAAAAQKLARVLGQVL